MPNRFPSETQNVSKLSKLQKRILEEGLKAHWHEPIRLAWGSREPGSFGIGEILEEFFGVDKEDIKRSYSWTRRSGQRERLAKPRAAISRAMSRLIKRGLLERTKPAGRGEWRLSPLGTKAAVLVCTTLQRPTRTEMLPKVKEAYAYRKTRLERAGQSMPISWKDFCSECFRREATERRGRRKGIEVDLDLSDL